MEQCIVAVFDNRAAAQQSMDELVASGFERQGVRLNERDPNAPAAASGGARDDRSIGDSLKDMFSDIFGSDNSPHARLYSEAIDRGNYVLTVAAADDEEVDRATIIVERFMPIDIDQQSALWSGGVPGQNMAGARQQAQPMSQQQSGLGSQQSGLGSQQAAAGSQQGSQQYAQGGSATPGQGSAPGSPQSQRSGVRVFPRDESSATSGGTEAEGNDAYFRGHWNNNYASHGNKYEDYAPAYQYGSSMKNNDQYRGKAWNDAETGLKADWESKNPGSAWEKFKAAIRHGWERITS
jgi:hypothetical protein